MGEIKNSIINGLSIDVEDYFQVSNFEKKIPFEKWNELELRVQPNTMQILDLLDKYNINATFFILGWIAMKKPELITEIAKRGHEIASHGFRHQLVYNLTPDEFRNDIRKTKDILEQLSGKKVVGYRAPSYSITKSSFWAMDILFECGYKYDSSIFPIRHHRYGIIDFPRFKKTVCLNNGNTICELPVSTAKILGKNFPVGGGAYFRLFPYVLSKWGLRKINETENQPFVFYFHPWEIDYGQPRFECSMFTKLRHYGNLDVMEHKLNKLFSSFKFGPLKDLV